MYIDVVAWDKLGEICNTYLKKGMSTLVEGALSIRKYETKDGEKRTAVEVVASNMQMLDSKGRANGEGGGSYDRSSAPRPAAAGNTFEEEELGEEIPF
jgi:single-strand DNA-binding protein